MSIDEIKRSISFHGLTDGFQRNPLRHFIANLRDYNVEIRFERAYVVLSYDGMNPEDVKESTEPYIYPVAELSMPLGKAKKSQWGVLSESAVKFLNTGEDIPNLIGKRLEMKMTGGHMMWDKDQGKETPRECWEIISVGGGSAVSPSSGISATDRAIELLIGKTEQEWYQVIYQEPAIKADAEVLGAIANKQFLPMVEQTGKAYKSENGVWLPK